MKALSEGNTENINLIYAFSAYREYFIIKKDARFFK